MHAWNVQELQRGVLGWSRMDMFQRGKSADKRNSFLLWLCYESSGRTLQQVVSPLDRAVNICSGVGWSVTAAADGIKEC